MTNKKSTATRRINQAFLLGEPSKRESAKSLSPLMCGFLLPGLMSVGLTSCGLVGDKVQVTRAPSVATTVTKVTPIAAKPDEVVSLTGNNFSTAKNLRVAVPLTNGESTSVPLTIKDSKTASFAMPEGAGLGLKDVKLTQGTAAIEVTSFNLIADQASNQLPIWIGEASELCVGKKYIDRNGDEQVGTKDCMARIADCSTNGSIGCVTTATFKSADLTNLAAGNIKSGVTIAGTPGQYPSASFPLTGSSGSDLTSETFNAQIKSSATFQYFGSDGMRYTGAGDTDIDAVNIVSGVDIFATEGSAASGVAPDPWDVRVGKTINGVAGKLKVNCRNRVSTSTPTLYNYDGAIGSIGQVGQTGGSVRDIWDTIDDYNNSQVGVPGGVVASWNSSTDCYGVESLVGDDNVWKDVTTTNGLSTNPSTCAATSVNCTMQDKITGLWWSQLQATGAWNTAWNTCVTTLNNTTYSGNSVAGYNGQTGWRLPTQKELMEAYTHGIRSAARTNWMTEANMNNWFWSGSSVSNDSDNAWNVGLANGNSDYYAKAYTLQVVCVR